MAGTYQRGDPKQVMYPVASATAVAEGDLCASVSDLLVPAGSYTWDTDETTTRKAFVAAFLGRSAQDKDANDNVFGHGGSFGLKVRVDTGGVYRYPVAAGTYVLFSLVGPKKQSGNLLESQTLQLVTDPSQAIGQVVGGEGVNPGYCDVEILTRKSLVAATIEAPVEILSFPINLASITGAGDVVTNYTPGFAGEILSVDFVVTVAVTTGSKAADLNLEIGTTNVTGGVVALTSALATPVGKVIAGSAVTAANVFTATDTISVEAANVTAFSEGAGVLQVRVRNRG